MKRCALSVWLGLALVSPAAALDGRVIDARSRAPLAGVRVAIAGSPGSVLTDADGRFTWRPAPRPPFTAIVIFPDGRVARPVHVVALPAPPAPIVLAIEPAISEALTVSGVAPHLDAAPGAAMTLVTAGDIAARAPATLAQALEDVAGASSTSDGQAAVPTLRGLARGRTLILIDGGRVTSERRAGASASFLEPALIESVTVARGPAPVAYGTDAIGGVIAVRTRRPADRAPLSFRATVLAGAGIPERRGSIEMTKGFAAGGMLAAVHARDAGDYAAPGAVVGNSSWRDAGFFARAEHRIGRGRASIAAQHDAGADLGRPRSDLASVRVFSPFERSTRLSASFESPRVAGIEQLRIDGLAARAHERAEQDRARAGSRPRAIDRSTLGASDAQLRLRGGRGIRKGSLEFGADITARYGLQVAEETTTYTLAGAVASTRESLSIASASRTSAGSFAQLQLPAGPRVTLAAGGRLDRLDVSSTGGFFGTRSRTRAAAAGFGSLAVAAAPGLSLTARVSRGFRDATLSDRFHRGPAGRGFITGNPDLEPETSRQIDVTAGYSHRRVRVSGGLYHYRIAQLIEVYTPAPDQSSFRNRGRAEVRGGELEAAIDIRRGWTLTLAAHASRGTALDDGAALNDVAPATLSAALRGVFARGVSVYVRGAAVARDDRPGPSEVAAPGYVDAGAGASVRLGRFVEVRASGRNLLDRRYYASPGTRWVYAPGRSGSIAATIRFEPGSLSR